MDSQPVQEPGLLGYVAQALWVLLAVVGGIAKSLSEYVSSNGTVVPKIGVLLATAIVSGFSGYMTLLLVSQFFPTWAGLAAGVGGWLGPKGVDFCIDILRTAVQNKVGNPTPPKDGAG